MSGMTSRLPVIALLAIASLTACAADVGSEDDDSTAAEVSFATAHSYNLPNVSHGTRYAHLKNGSAVPLSYADGSPTGTVIVAKESKDRSAPNGNVVRISTLERIVIGGAHHWFTWGETGGTEGWIEGNELEPVGGRLEENIENRAGNGAKCELIPGKEYVVDPKPIDTSLRFRTARKKTNPESETAKLHPWSNSYDMYGVHSPIPASKGGSSVLDGARFTFLTWSWVAQPGGVVEGGGVARTLLKAGTIFRPCRVASIIAAAYSPSKSEEVDGDPGGAKGWVRAMYGRVEQGSETFYGWAVHSSHVDGHATQLHLRLEE